MRQLISLPQLNNQVLPARIITCMVNRGIIDNHFLDGINNMSELETEIMTYIFQYADNHNVMLLQRIFHLIQIWGGDTGRYPYVRQVFNWDNIQNNYQNIIEHCLLIHDYSVENQNGIITTIMENHIPYLGLSFITKHIHFWLRVNLGLNALPIYDSIMSQRVIHVRQSYNGLRLYWTRMIELAEEMELPLAVLERNIFNGLIIVD